MCYNIAFLTKRLEKYAERYKDTLPPEFLSTVYPEQSLPVYYFVSGFEYPVLPVVTAGGVVHCSWGLIPSWTRDSESAAGIRSKTHNAVGETAFEKPSFKKSIASRRCLLGVNGFYEWRLFNKTKYPYLVTSKSNEIFSLGCLFDEWTSPTGEVVQSFSIITTPANPLMQVIHNTKKRMPLIIDREHEMEWVSPALSMQEVKALIRPYERDDLKADTISMTANYVRSNRNTPDIMRPVNYPELNFFGM